jgi:Fe-S-cluster containining protein
VQSDKLSALKTYRERGLDKVPMIAGCSNGNTDRKTAVKAEREEKKQLRRDSPFSYDCRQCNRCCTSKIIRINPYEVARLAANLGISTTDFIRTRTLAHGTVLKITGKGECIFRTLSGCSVHPDRPLVCRLYPLGRHVTAKGEESFSLLPPHPQSEGIFGHDGTVADYLENQGAEPYIDSVDQYLELLTRMLSTFRSDSTAAAGEAPNASDGTPKRADQSVQIGLEWLDMDLLVSEYCTGNGLEMPVSADEKMKVHIQAIETKLAMLKKGG